jgi:chromate transporter
VALHDPLDLLQYSVKMMYPNVVIEVLFVFLKLGIRSFGGPVAHLGYFHETFVRNKKWISESDFADTVALCQILPGPTSSQVGMVIGSTRAGVRGAIAAWIGFTLPSAVIMFTVGFAAMSFSSVLPFEMLHGLKLAALAVVAHAVVSMFVSLCTDFSRKWLAAAVALAAFVFKHPFAQITLIIGGAVFGLCFFRNLPESSKVLREVRLINYGSRRSFLFLSAFFVLLFVLPIVANTIHLPLLTLFEKCFRSGALVFGGGHVVLPLLENEFVGGQLLNKETFLAGYGTAQAIPGPLFSFAAFLGAASMPSGMGVVTAGLASAVAVFGIFMPSFLLLPGFFPLWKLIKNFASVDRALAGVNATVVGLLASVLLDEAVPVVGLNPASIMLLAVNFALLKWARLPSWAVVVLSTALAFVGVGLLAKS